MNQYKVFRYLRVKKYARGTELCRVFNLPLHRVAELEDVPGTGGFGPLEDKFKRSSLWIRYAKQNVFMADFLGIFRYRGRLYCIKTRKLRKGYSKPRKENYENCI